MLWAWFLYTLWCSRLGGNFSGSIQQLLRVSVAVEWCLKKSAAFSLWQTFRSTVSFVSFWQSMLLLFDKISNSSSFFSGILHQNYRKINLLLLIIFWGQFLCWILNVWNLHQRSLLEGRKMQLGDDEDWIS